MVCQKVLPAYRPSPSPLLRIAGQRLRAASSVHASQQAGSALPGLHIYPVARGGPRDRHLRRPRVEQHFGHEAFRKQRRVRGAAHRLRRRPRGLLRLAGRRRSAERRAALLHLGQGKEARRAARRVRVRQGTECHLVRTPTLLSALGQLQAALPGLRAAPGMAQHHGYPMRAFPGADWGAGAPAVPIGQNGEQLRLAQSSRHGPDVLWQRMDPNCH